MDVNRVSADVRGELVATRRGSTASQSDAGFRGWTVTRVLRSAKRHTNWASSHQHPSKVALPYQRYQDFARVLTTVVLTTQISASPSAYRTFDFPCWLPPQYATPQRIHTLTYYNPCRFILMQQATVADPRSSRNPTKILGAALMARIHLRTNSSTLQSHISRASWAVCLATQLIHIGLLYDFVTAGRNLVANATRSEGNAVANYQGQWLRQVRSLAPNLNRPSVTASPKRDTRRGATGVGDTKFTARHSNDELEQPKSLWNVSEANRQSLT